MSDDADLARRAVACTRWVWCEGPHLTSGHVYLGQDADGEEFYVDGGLIRDGRYFPHTGEPYHPYDFDDEDADAVGQPEPDITHPLTLGWLLALVRKAWGQDVHAQRHGIGWMVWGYERIATGPTEASALVAALESAP